MYVLVCVLVCGCRVMAENDFLHTLLTKVTTSRGDSGGQGKVVIPTSKYVVLSGIISLCYRFITSLCPMHNPPNGERAKVRIIMIYLRDLRAEVYSFH